jgi:hypothetical protein
MERMQRRINDEVKALFAAGAVQRVVLLRHGDDPAIGPEQLMVRVFIGATGGPEDHQRSLDEWAQAHQAGMKRLRLELSLRLPEAKLLEFTVDGADAATRITMPDDPALTSAPLTARETVETALALLRAGYVFPDLAEQAAAAIEVRLAAGEYDGLDEPALADLLTSQLNEMCADKHLRVRTMPPRALPAPTPPPHPARPEPAEPAGPAPAPRERRRPPHNFHADAGETRQFWTLAYVPGSRYLGRPVYLLTSSETFSGGEDLCYTLQAQGRAEVIGERTGGGAHPTRMVPISATMVISVPFVRSVNPVTGTNWQGTGVVRDTDVPAAEAYDVAYGKALRHVLSTDVPPPVADEARAALAGLPGEAQH